jgi:hypothetical protein
MRSIFSSGLHISRGAGETEFWAWKLSVFWNGKLRFIDFLVLRFSAIPELRFWMGIAE